MPTFANIEVLVPKSARWFTPKQCILSIVLLVSALSPLKSYGGQVSREDLFKRAFSSTAYLMSMSEMDSSFTAQLSAEEKRMLVLVRDVAQMARNRQWFRENQIQNIPNKDVDQHYYVFKGGYWYGEQAVPARTPMRFDLEFSRDQSLFRLKAGEPARSAMTFADWDKNIFVNLEIINSSLTQISFSDAVQILVHEFGHKLGAQKNQQAVDSLAAKLKSFLDLKTSSFKTSSGKVSILKLETSLFADWLDVTLEGRYLGSNQKNRLEPFRVYDGEGIYVLAETAVGVFDLTSDVQKQFLELTKFAPYAGLPYNWKHFDFFESRFVAVREVKPGEIKVDIDVIHSEGVVPFIKSGDPDPAQTKPWEALFNRGGEAGTYNYNRVETTFALSGTRPSVSSKIIRPKIFEQLRLKAQVISAKEVGPDFEIKIQVDGKVSVQGSEGEATRAYLVVSNGSRVLEVEGQSRGTELVFVIKQSHRLSGDFKIASLEFEPLIRNWGKRYYIRTRTYLTESASYKFSQHTLVDKPRLTKIEVWNGGHWISDLSSPASQIRFVFDGIDFIRDLKVSQTVKHDETVRSTMTVGTETKVLGEGTRALADLQTSFTAPQSSLKQEMVGSQLIVTYQLDAETVLAFKKIDDITPADLPPPMRQQLLEETNTVARAERLLTAIEVTTAAGDQVLMPLPKPFLLKVQPLSR